MDSRSAAHVLSQIGALLQVKGEQKFKARAYAGAARSLIALDTDDLAPLLRSGELADTPGIGPATLSVVRELVETGESSSLEEFGDSWDAEPVTSSDGSTLAVVENRNGASMIWVADAAEPKERSEISLAEPGVVTSHLIRMPILSRDGAHLYYTLSSPRLAGDVWESEVATGTPRNRSTSILHGLFSWRVPH